MLDDNHVVGRGDEATDDSGGGETLSDVEVRRRLVEHVHVGVTDTGDGDSETLELSTRKLADLSFLQTLELEVGLELVPVRQLGLAIKHLAHGHVGDLDTPRDLVHVLRLGHSLEVVLQHLCEEVLELRTAEILEDLGPLGRIIVSTEIGLELARKNLERRRLADTVGADKTEDLTGTGSGQSMQLERVGLVSVRDVRLEVGGQVEDLDRFERASARVSAAPAWYQARRYERGDCCSLLHADTATNAQLLRDERLLVRRVDLDTQLPHLNNGTRPFALLTTGGVSELRAPAPALSASSFLHTISSACTGITISKRTDNAGTPAPFLTLRVPFHYPGMNLGPSSLPSPSLTLSSDTMATRVNLSAMLSGSSH